MLQGLECWLVVVVLTSLDRRLHFLSSMKANATQRMTFLLCLQMLSFKSFGDIGFLDGGFHKDVTDLEIRQDRRNFKLRRHYNSRSLHQGLFGFGWCSDLEKSLDLRLPGQVTLQDCLFSEPIVFQKITSRLFQNSFRPSDVVTFENGRYVRKTSQSIQTFDSRGRFVSLADHAGFEMRIEYDHDSPPARLFLGDRLALRLKMDPGRRRVITVSEAGSDSGVTYGYHKDLLVSVSGSEAGSSSSDFAKGFNASSSQNERFLKSKATKRSLSSEPASTLYSYDELKNLTEIRFANRTTEKIEYDSRNDRAISHQPTTGCLTKFDYKTLGPLEYATTANKHCPNRPLEKLTYQFAFQKSATGEPSLHKIQRSLKTDPIDTQQRTLASKPNRQASKSSAE